METRGSKERHMVQVEAQPVAGERGVREMYLILYPKELEDEILQALESTGVPGYTEMPKMVGRGRHIKHFDNAVWPGATGCIFTVVDQILAQATLLPTL